MTCRAGNNLGVRAVEVEDDYMSVVGKHMCASSDLVNPVAHAHLSLQVHRLTRRKPLAVLRHTSRDVEGTTSVSAPNGFLTRRPRLDHGRRTAAMSGCASTVGGGGSKPPLAGFRAIPPPVRAGGPAAKIAARPDARTAATRPEPSRTLAVRPRAARCTVDTCSLPRRNPSARRSSVRSAFKARERTSGTLPAR